MNSADPVITPPIHLSTTPLIPIQSHKEITTFLHHQKFLSILTNTRIIWMFISVNQCTCKKLEIKINQMEILWELRMYKWASSMMNRGAKPMGDGRKGYNEPMKNKRNEHHIGSKPTFVAMLHTRMPSINNGELIMKICTIWYSSWESTNLFVTFRKFMT